MKSFVFLGILAFVAAEPVRNDRIVISTPKKLVVVSRSENQKENQLLEQEKYKYPQQYWPQGNSTQVAQYITYELRQARQKEYTTAEVSSYLTKQGFPQSVAKYITKEYESSKTQLSGQSSYQTFQYYYEQDIPQNVQQCISQQIALVHQSYRENDSKNEKQVIKQEYPDSQSVVKYVTEMARYYRESGVSYPVAQYASQQLQQVAQYIQNALLELENENVLQDGHQYVIQRLQKGQQYTQDAIKVYQAYQIYNEYYIPYFAAQYALQQTQEAYQCLQNAYQNIKQQKVQRIWPQFSQYIFQQVQLAYQGAQNANKINQPSQFYQKERFFDFDKYIAEQLQEAQQYAQKAQQFVQQQVAQGKKPQSLVTNIVQQFQQGLTYTQEAYQAVQQIFGSQSPQYSALQTQQALEYFQKAYQAIVQHSFDISIIKQCEYALQHAQNAYFAAQQAGYQSLYPGYPSFRLKYGPADNLNYYEAIEQIKYSIVKAQQYIKSQDMFPHSRIIVQKLAQVYQVYQSTQELFRQGCLPQPILQYARQRIQQANQYLFVIYQVAQQQGLQYVAQQLKYLLQLAQNLQYTDQFSNSNQDEEQYKIQYSAQYAAQQLQLAQQYIQNLKLCIQEQIANENFDQSQVKFVLEQLQQIQQYIQKSYEATQQEYGSQSSAQYVAQQVLLAEQVLQNLYQYVLQQYFQNTWPQMATKFAEKQIQLALQGLQNTNQAAQCKPIFLKDYEYSYGSGSNYRYKYADQKLEQPYDYSKSAQQDVQQLTSQGIIFPQYAKDIKDSYPTYGLGSLYNTKNSAQQNYQNIYQYIKKQGTNGNNPEHAADDYFNEQVENNQQMETFYQPFQQKQYYGQEYPGKKPSFTQALIQKYYKKNFQFPSKYVYPEQNQNYSQESGYSETYNPFTFQYEPKSYDYYGPYRSSGSYFSPYQYESYEDSDTNQSDKPY